MARTTDELIAELSEFLRIPSISSGDGTVEDLAAAAQWREVEDEIDADDGVRLPHADVRGRMRQKFGR